MLAIIGAAFFGLALIFDLAKTSLGSVVTIQTLIEAGLLCVALHLAGIGGPFRWRSNTRRR